MSRKNKAPQIVENVRILDITNEGKSIAKVDDLVYFVDEAIPDDVVDLMVTRKKSNFREATPIHYHQYSPKRTKAFCTHFGTCGGCKWQHLDEKWQLHYKQKQVSDALQRIGKVKYPEIRPILASENTKHYRNKLEFTFTNSRWLTREQITSGKEYDRRGVGFHLAGQFNRVLDVHECFLQEDISNQIRNGLRDFAKNNQLSFYDWHERKGLLRGMVVRTTSIGELMVIIQFFENQQEEVNMVMEYLKNNFPQITSLMYVINSKANDTFHDLEVLCWNGLPYITEKMEDLQFRIGAKSFFQTNSKQAYQLYKITRDFAQLTGKEVVYDLYTGTGTIAMFVAKNAKEVIGMEYVEMAIGDAKINATLNKIDNCKFYAGDIKDLLNAQFLSQHALPDVVITDPPRAGMHEDVVKQLLNISPKRIVYVSCNPATQARDLNLLDVQYEIKAVQPVDMFPHTHHVENVVLLEKK
jgi:23S rRNA (uracil1939-C5)-methyltransferase